MFSAWLNTDLEVKITGRKPSNAVGKSLGRPCLSFVESSGRSKRRKIADTLESVSSSETALLVASAKKAANLNGEKTLAKILGTVLEQMENGTLEDLLKKMHSPPSPQFTSSTALALLLETNISRDSYQLFRSTAMGIDSNLFPSYKRVQEEKKECQPDQIVATADRAHVPWKNLIQHTIQRTLHAFPNEFEEKCANLGFAQTLTATIGCGLDGSSNFLTLNQRLNENVDDNHLIVVVMNLLAIHDELSQDVIYLNPLPQSPHSIRPQKMLAAKETKDLNKQEYETMMSEIAEIEPFPITLPSGKFLKFKLNFKKFNGFF